MADRHKNRTREQVTMLVRAIEDNALSIDSQLAEAREKVDWRRRRRAEKSLAAWVATYGIGVFVDDPPPPNGVAILGEMEMAVGDSRPYQILMARGHGKTSYTEGCVAYSIATGKRKFCVISSINATQAKQILTDITRIFTSEPFATDYPDIACPICLLDGHNRRQQRQGGHDVAFKSVTGELILPTITDQDGNPTPASGSCIKARALKSVRGSKHGTLRPDLVVLDDLQTTESAHNPERVKGVIDLIRGDVMGLAGKNKAAIISTATTIAREDVTEVLKADKSWKTTEFKAVLSWPAEWHKPGRGLWGRYLSMLDAEDAEDRPHTGSLAFYRKHRKQMDAGASVLFPGRFRKEDGHLSAIQKLVESFREMGEARFNTEMQMEPPRGDFVFKLTPKLVLSRVFNGYGKLSMPPGYRFVAAATDINSSRALTTCIAAFDQSRAAFVMAHFIERVAVDQDQNETGYNSAVYSALAHHGQILRELHVPINAWGIDAGGRNKTAVLSFCREARQKCGILATGMFGRSEKMTNFATVKNRLQSAREDTVLCGVPSEWDAWARYGQRNGETEPQKWMLWNADLYKEIAQRAWNTEPGAPGGCSLYDGGDVHTDFAIQVSNEDIVRKVENEFGRNDYTWKTREPHDYGDCMAMCYALAANAGVSGSPIGNLKTSHKRRVRIV